MRLRAILFAVVVLRRRRRGGLAGSPRSPPPGTRPRTADAARGGARGGRARTGRASRPTGSKVTLAGAAPDETSRFRALEIARQVVDDGPDRPTRRRSRAAAPLPPPPFALELLRNEADVSLIGLVPETGGRDVIRAALGAGGLGDERHRHARIGLRPGARGLARGARLRPLGARRAAARQDQRRARRGAGDRGRRQRRRPRARSRRGCERAAPEGVTLDARHLGAAAGDRALRLRLQPRRTASGRLAACSAESAEAGGGDPRRGARRRASPARRDCRGRPRRAVARLGGGGGARARRAEARSAAGASRSATSRPS